MPVRFASALATMAAVAHSKHYFDGLDRVHLQVNSDNHFKIMQITDLQFGEMGQGKADSATLDMIRKIADKEKPDFVAVTGDIVSGQAWDRESQKFWENHYNMMAVTLKNLEVPWGIVPGFHDFEADANAQMMLDLEAQEKYAASMPNFYNHYGKDMHHQFTYVVPIESKLHTEETAARIYFFGTGRANCMNQGGMNCIRRDQVEWFKDKSDGIPDDDPSKPNGIAFMHHALEEHLHLVNHSPTHGQKRDITHCQGINTGLFTEIVQKGTIQWVSAGGDHSSDFWGTYAGVNLGYGRKTGYASFGPKFAHRGARIFDLEFDQDGKMTIDTWIRNDQGEYEGQSAEKVPPLMSFLKSDHCYGSQEQSDPGFWNEWLPNFS